jgi:hypothetical protein
MSQLTERETETIMASIEGAAMRMPSPNRDDELDDAEEISPLNISIRNESSRMNKTGNMVATNNNWHD